MKAQERGFSLSATDLSNFLACRHRIGLEMAAAAGKIRKPRFDDPQLEALFRRGLEHERAHVEALGSAGRNVVDLSKAPNHELAGERTLAALVETARAGVLAPSKPSNLVTLVSTATCGTGSHQMDTRIMPGRDGGSVRHSPQGNPRAHPG